jgi:O-methyltransferase domain
MDTTFRDQDDPRTPGAFIRGLAVSQMIGAACDVDLPDALEPGQRVPLHLMAKKLDVNQDALRRLCRALSRFGFFIVDGTDHIAHNSWSLLLRKDQQPSYHWAARFWTLPCTWSAWGNLRYMIKTGQEAYQAANGKQFFDHICDNQDERTIYQRYMATGYPGRHEAIAANLNLAGSEIVVDIGGGNGSLIRALICKYPGITGVVYDLRAVIEDLQAQSMFPVANCRLESGDFFQTIPSGGDVYILSYILHDWPDNCAIKILRRCRQVMRAESRLTIVERLLDSDPAKCDPDDLLTDLNMLVLHRGLERTTFELDSLLEQSGFGPSKPVLLQPGYSICETSPR